MVQSLRIGGSDYIASMSAKETVVLDGRPLEEAAILSLPRSENSHSESGRERLRDLLTRIGRELATLPSEAMRESDAASARRLAASWEELVVLLALGPAPQLRECPACKHEGMRAATRCGYCWEKLAPLAATT